MSKIVGSKELFDMNKLLKHVYMCTQGSGQTYYSFEKPEQNTSLFSHICLCFMSLHLFGDSLLGNTTGNVIITAIDGYEVNLNRLSRHVIGLRTQYLSWKL